MDPDPNIHVNTIRIRAPEPDQNIRIRSRDILYILYTDISIECKSETTGQGPHYQQ